ncbi:hypothetical protein KEM55_005597, partial [Ascosphaera atra]
MPHYIRFLKPPQVEVAKGQYQVNCLVTVTNDLGDEFLYEPIPLTATLLTKASGSGDFVAAASREFAWYAGCRQLKITFGPLKQTTRPSTIQVYVGKGPDSKAVIQPLHVEEKPSVLAAWSCQVDTSRSVRAEQLVERRLEPALGPPLSIWEETGNSIARHIWDAALATVLAIQQASLRDDGMECLSPIFGQQWNGRNSIGKKRQIIELGTGCGMVGLYIAQACPSTSVLLTDLEEVRDVLELNLKQAKTAPQSSASFQVLDWEEELPANIQTLTPDAIIVSDCTYNEASFVPLAQTLSRLVAQSPQTIVLVAYKKRHQSEKAFFQCMKDHRFT